MAEAKAPQPLLSAAGLGLLRGERRLFGPLDIALHAGELLVVEGSNGAGKTSLLRLLAGLVEADAGVVHWRGYDTRRNRQAFAAELAWYGHQPGCKQDLTLLENLAFERALGPQSSLALEAAVERLQLSQLVSLPLRSLSAGQQRRVALCRLLLSDATLWLLDEPYTNLDRAGQALVDEVISEQLGRGGACVLASHRPVDIGANSTRLALS